MERAAAVTRTLLDAAMARCVAGATPNEIERWLGQEIVRIGARRVEAGKFAAAASIAVNDAAAHALPTDRQLCPGDLVTVDLPLCVAGWWSDLADSMIVGAVGGRASAWDDPLLKALRMVLGAMVDAIGPGRLWSSVSAAAEERSRSLGVGLVGDLAGHGIGRDLHEPPVAWLGAGPDFTLRPGMCLTLEPIVVEGSPELVAAADGVTLRTADGGRAAGIERVVVVTRQGCRVLGEPG